MTIVPLVSIVMPVYNGGKYLKEAIESILKQKYHNFEFIIINDGSTDNTIAILDNYVQIDKRICVYHQEKSGLVTSLNRGCRIAQGKYIARMDADDISFPDRLQRQIGFLAKHPDIAILGGSYVLLNSSGIETITLYKPLKHRQIKAMLSHCSNPFLHPAIIMRKEAFHAINGYRRTFLHAEDYDLWLRFTERYKSANLPEPVLYYRVHHNQVSHHNLEQGIFSVLGSQAAARIKRETGRDPVFQFNRFTSEILYDLGVPYGVLQKTLTEAYFWQANLMLLSGYDVTALRLFRKALNYSRSKYLRKKIGSGVFCAYVKTYKKQGKLLRRMFLELFLLVSAYCTQFSLAQQLVCPKISRLLQMVRSCWLKDVFRKVSKAPHISRP